MNKSESIQVLAAALVQAQAEMPSAKCDGVNKIYGSKFTTLGEIIDTAQPILTKHGLAISQIITNDEDRVGVETILMHSSGEYISNKCCVRIEPFAPETNKEGKVITQKPVVLAGSTISYLRRYGLLSILGMYSEEDTSENQSKRRPARSTGTPAPKPGTTPAPQVQILAHGLPRPYMPAVLKEKIASRAAAKKGLECTANQRKEVWQGVRDIFKAMPLVGKALDTVVHYLTGMNDFNLVSDSFILALHDWLDFGPTGSPSATTITEAMAVWNMESK